MAVLTTSYQLIASKYIGDASSSTTKNVYLRIYAKYTSQDIAGNKSNVSYKSTLYVDGGGTYFYTGNYTTKTLSGTGATAVSYDAQGNYYLGETTLCEITGTVSHGSAGDASVSITAGWVSTPWGINGSLSGTATLPTIARATTPTLSATSVTMGGSVTITLNPANSTFKHKLRYDFVNATGQASGMSIGSEFSAAGNTTVTFTPPTSLSSQIPNANSANCSVICYTYLSNGTHVGTKTVNLTLSVPSYNPSISSIALTGNNLLSSTYVQGKSTVTAKITASTSYNATISSYSSVIDGKTYTGATFTTSALSNGSKTVVTTIKDSRGKTATLTSSAITVYAYSVPSITKFTLERQSDGTTVLATVTGSVAAINNKNAKTITVTLNGVTQTITSSSYTISGTTTFTGVSTDSTFTGIAKITDSYTSATKDFVLPTVAVTMDFYKDGKGVAFGKVAETTELLDIAWSERVRKNLTVDGTQTVTGNATMSGALTVKGTAKVEKSLEVSSSTFGATTINRNDSENAAAIKFVNTNGSLGYIGMTQTPDTGLRRWKGDSSGAYFVLDTGNLTNYIKDYVIEQGTSSGWEYTKWNNGKIELYGDKSLSFPAGSLQTTNLYRSIVSLDLKSLLTNILSGTCAIQTNGMVPQVCRHGTTKTTAEIVIVTSRTFDAFTVTAPIYIIGKWK